LCFHGPILKGIEILAEHLLGAGIGAWLELHI
jgi:hypothetical protein